MIEVFFIFLCHGPEMIWLKMITTKESRSLVCDKWLSGHVVVIMITIIALTEPSKAASLWSKTSRQQLNSCKYLLSKQMSNQFAESPPTPIGTIERTSDITRLVGLPTIGNSEVFSQALELLTSLQAAPSCNRLATSALLTDCQSVESNSPQVETTLDDIKSIYSAQLALCELQSAGAQIPSTCKFNFLLDTGNAPKRFDHHYHNKLKQCLSSLESRPQWWTSYSNSKQNALVLCQAARVEIEKGKCGLVIVIEYAHNSFRRSDQVT